MRVDLDGAEERRRVEEAERQRAAVAAGGDDAHEIRAEHAGPARGGMGDVGLDIAQEAQPRIGVGLLDAVGAGAAPRLIAVAVDGPAVDGRADAHLAGRSHGQRRNLDEAHRHVAAVLERRPQDHGLADALDRQIEPDAGLGPERRPVIVGGDQRVGAPVQALLAARDDQLRRGVAYGDRQPLAGGELEPPARDVERQRHRPGHRARRVSAPGRRGRGCESRSPPCSGG